MSEDRLQKVLARCGFGSRRSCEKLILDGKVSVNGEVVATLGAKADPDVDVIRVDGIEAHLPSDQVTLILNKPKGYITAMKDAHGARCVSELMPMDAHPSLFPVGRLDKDTTGLLIVTTDGELGNLLMHPSSKVDKTYRALIEGMLSDAEVDALENGIMIDGKKTAKARVRVESAGKTSRVLITIHEGRNRQVRKMFSAVGHKVLELERISYGSLELGALRPGDTRILTSDELLSLKQCCLH